jgi:hypothetical protein
MHSMNSAGSDEFAIYYVVIATMHGPRHDGDGLAHGSRWRRRSGFTSSTISAPFWWWELQAWGSRCRCSRVAPDRRLMAWGVSGLLLMLGMLLAFVLSPFAPLPKGQALRRKETRAAP